MINRKANGVGHYIVGSALTVKVVDIRAQVQFVQGLGNIIEVVTATRAVILAAFAIVGSAAAARTVTIVIAQSTIGADIVVVVGFAIGQQYYKVFLTPVADGRRARNPAGK